jgi:Shedu protein SduA, C-terminal
VSGEIRPVLIEIEQPQKRWFNGSGDQSAELTHALGQLTAWRAWFDSEANRMNFFERYEVDGYVRRRHVFNPVFSLIYGRRSEFADNPELSRRRGAARPANVEWSTFDRLRPHAHARGAVTCRVTASGWRVVSVPPTYTLGPYASKTLVKMTGWEEAIGLNDLISDDRKNFLLSRLEYWRQWELQERKGIVRSGDQE